MNTDEIKEQLRKNKFVKNNGAVLRSINLLRTDFVNLYDVANALTPQLSESEVMDCVNYLHEAEYIRLISVRSKQPVSCIGDDFEALAAKLTAKGIQLLNGVVDDPCIDL